MLSDFEIDGDISGERLPILSTEAVHFLTLLHDNFELRRKHLLQRRQDVVAELRAGEPLGLLPETEWMRFADWKVASPPHDLRDRRVEITGPTDAKMMINALNSGAKVFMADLEDSLAPTWSNVVDGQINLLKAVRRELRHISPEGKTYSLNSECATLVVRPRGWHMNEGHVRIRGEKISASLFDFGLYFYHNARTLCAAGSGPYFYLPKLESHLEARLWNDVFLFAQKSLGLPVGTIRATVLIETIPAAFEMEEILFELREHITGLNAGRWDYLFSLIKKFSHNPHVVYPDRDQLTMTLPFMRAYTQRLIDTCHRRGAHAMGGMAAFIPSRRDPEVNASAFKKVREDKLREANDGFDGTWVAHPDLVPVAREIFDQVLGSAPHQKSKLPTTVPNVAELLPTNFPLGIITKAGIENNLLVALQYIDSWLRGVGAVGINNLMEDAATAEISRAELWQWVRYEARDSDGEILTIGLFNKKLEAAVSRLGGTARLMEAASLLKLVVLTEQIPDFFTTIAYELMDGGRKHVRTHTEKVMDL